MKPTISSDTGAFLATAGRGGVVGDLAVTVRLNGVLVEDQVIPVHSVVRIGESADALVHFPGADVAVVRLGKRLAMRGRSLEEGEEMEISLGATHVHIRHTNKFRPPSALQATIDDADARVHEELVRQQASIDAGSGCALPFAIARPQECGTSATRH